MIEGQCLCGKVQYCLSSDLLFMYHCHCMECRRYSGSSFACNAAIVAADFSLRDPEESLQEYKTANGSRFFCRDCGTPIYSCAAGSTDYPSLHCGSINGHPETRPSANLWLAEKCPWVDVDEALQNYQGAIEA